MSISLRDLLAKTFPPQSYWIGEGLLKRGSIMVVGGAPKSYKSFALNTIFTHLIAGGPLFGATSHTSHGPLGRFDCPGGAKVLYFEQEVGEEDLQERFRTLAGTLPPETRETFLDSLHFESCNHNFQLDNPAGVVAIERSIAAFKPSVVVFDPIVEFHTGDENDAQTMTRILRTIDGLRERHNFTTILSHHNKKPGDAQGGLGGSDNSPDRLRGSSTLYGKGDAFLMLNVTNRNAGLVNVTTVLRRGKPVKPFWIKLNRDTLRFEWGGWKMPKVGKTETGDED